jgi:hypothetical protein
MPFSFRDRKFREERREPLSGMKIVRFDPGYGQPVVINARRVI